MKKSLFIAAAIALAGCDAAALSQLSSNTPTARNTPSANGTDIAQNTFIYQGRPAAQQIRQVIPQGGTPDYYQPAYQAPNAQPLNSRPYVQPQTQQYTSQHTPQTIPQAVSNPAAVQPSGTTALPRLNPHRQSQQRPEQPIVQSRPASPNALVAAGPAAARQNAQGRTSDAISVNMNDHTLGSMGINTNLVYASIGRPGDPTPPRIEFNIVHLPQEEPLWCWAAAAQQAIGWVNNGRAPAQCAIVGLAHGIPPEECCADRKGVCAKTGEIPAIAELVRRFGGVAEEIATPRDPRVIYEQLTKGKTMLIRLRPAPHDQAVGIRHMIVVRGIEWLRLPNGKLTATLLYNDPLGEDQRQVDFEEIVGFFEQAMLLSRP